MSRSFRNPQFTAALNQAVASGGSQFSDLPTNYTNLVAWWKADSLSLSDGTAVASWLDSSPTGTNLSASGTEQPTFKTAIYNGYPTVRFNGLTNRMALSSVITIGASGPFTIIGIVKASVDSILLGYSGINIQIRKFRSGGNTISQYFNSLDQFSSTFSSAATDLVSCCWRRGSWRENTTSRGTWVDNSPFFLDYVSYVSYGQRFTGDICEVCIYAQTLDDASVDSLYTNYFKPKWGLP